MRSLYLLFVALLAALPFPANAAENHIAAALIAEQARPNAGETVRLAIRMNPDNGWHGYWQNPGDSGMPPNVQWTLPAGVKISELRHPAPAIQTLAGFVSYVYDGPFTLLADLKTPASLESGSALPIRAKLRWLACSDSMCVPESAELAIDLQISSGQETPARSNRQFQKFEDAIPRRHPTIGELSLVEGGIELSIVPPSGLSAPSARLFPITRNIFPASALVTTRRVDGRLIFMLPAPDTAIPDQFEAVIDSGRGSRAYRITARPAITVAPVTEGTPPPASVATSQTGDSSPVRSKADADAPKPAGSPIDVEPAVEPQKIDIARSETVPTTMSLVAAAQTPARIEWQFAFLGALLGGLLLNLMPCVFPILSLKAMSLARAGFSESAARREGIAYTAGAVLAAIALGATLVGLRAAGSEIGWAFQLQNPYIILGLSALMTLIAANLLGVFEFRSLSLGMQSLNRDGPAGAFGTGALAAFIATPCSGPFMGAALGAAVILPVPAALAIFAGLGLGLALPFLALGFIPPLRTRLPKPGRWMNQFRRILALPILVTAAALLWVLSRQTGAFGLATGIAFALATGLILAWLGTRQRAGLNAYRPLTALPVAALAAFLILPPASSHEAPTDLADANVRPFSETTLEKLRAAGTPVFVDFTADWCLTCKVNEKIAINTDEVQAAFRQAGVITLVGDWTNADPEISRFLAAHGRNSIPFYLFYPSDADPVILPQILTSDLLAETAHKGRAKRPDGGAGGRT